MPPDVLGTREDIQNAAGVIERFTTGLTFEQFESDILIRSTTERHFEIMGEAVNRLRRHAPEIAARISAANQAVALRNALIHGYDRVDYPALWQAATVSLPVLRAEVEALLREQGGYSAG